MLASLSFTVIIHDHPSHDHYVSLYHNKFQEAFCLPLSWWDASQAAFWEEGSCWGEEEVGILHDVDQDDDDDPYDADRVNDDDPYDVDRDYGDPPYDVDHVNNDDPFDEKKDLAEERRRSGSSF